MITVAGGLRAKGVRSMDRDEGLLLENILFRNGRIESGVIEMIRAEYDHRSHIFTYDVADTDIDFINDTIEVSDVHALNTDTPIVFTVLSGSLPDAIVEGTVYYVIEVDHSRIQVSATPGGAALDLVFDAAGTYRIRANASGDVILADLPADITIMNAWVVALDGSIASEESSSSSSAGSSSSSSAGSSSSSSAGSASSSVPTGTNPDISFYIQTPGDLLEPTPQSWIDAVGSAQCKPNGHQHRLIHLTGESTVKMRIENQVMDHGRYLVVLEYVGSDGLLVPAGAIRDDFTYRLISDDDTVLASDDVIEVDLSANDVELLLPDSNAAGRRELMVTIVDDGNELTLVPADNGIPTLPGSGDSIIGKTQYCMSKLDESVTIYTDGSGRWNIKARALETKRGVIHKAPVNWVSTSTLTIGQAAERSVVRDVSDIFTMEWDGTIAVDIAVAGTGGLDFGAEDADTWYSVWVIGDSNCLNAVSALISESETDPLLPEGYDVKRRLGWVRNNAGSNFLKFKQDGLRFQYDEEATALQVLTAGNATAFADIDCTALAPVSSCNLEVHNEFNPGATNRSYRLRPDGSTVVLPPHTFTAQSSSQANNNFTMLTDNQILEYEVDNMTDALDVFITGYTDDL